MKSLMLLCETVLRDLSTRCGTSSTSLDFKYVKARSEHEGLSFLMITLPRYGKDFQKSLDRGWVDHDMFQGLTWHAGLPRFLGGFLDLVFDRRTGRLLDKPSIDAIFSFRQFTLMWEKMVHECTPRRVRDTVEVYVQCEKDVKYVDRRISEEELSSFFRLSTILWGNPMQHVNNEVQSFRITPRHGPGAVADRLTSNGKFNLNSWTRRLDGVFPYEDELLANPHFYEGNRVDILEPGAELPCRLTHVPKTLKAPRLIAIEPACMMFMQQGLWRSLKGHLERGNYQYPSRPWIGNNTPFPWLIGFSDQQPNRCMAKEGSQFGNLATLDLSEASDRVSNQLVRKMMSRMPFLSAAVQASRSQKVDVPGYGVSRIAKFASMGSALTFPVEAMVFSTVVLLGIEDELNHQLTREEIYSLRGKVRVYGDDIIVPVEYVRAVIDRLEAFGFKVNRAKSFWTGKFRESCGGDYYDGVNVTVTRLRRKIPRSRKDVQELISYVSFRNQCYVAGLWTTVRLLDRQIGKLIPFPAVLPTSPILGRYSYLGYDADRSCPHLHHPLVRGMVERVVPPVDILDGHGALMKFFLANGEMPITDRRHLERSGRSVPRITRKWASSV